MGDKGKDRITVTISPYVKEKLRKYVGKGKNFSSNSDAANTALIELFLGLRRWKRLIPGKKKEKDNVWI